MFPPGWHETVRKHHKRTAGYVLAQSDPCTETRDLEASDAYVYGRGFEALEPDDLQDLDLPASWFLGVLVCPGDDLTTIAEWVAQLDEASLVRIRFYVHDDADLVAAFEPWYERGLPSPKTAPLTLGPRFHKTYGKDHGIQVVRDANRLGW